MQFWIKSPPGTANPVLSGRREFWSADADSSDRKDRLARGKLETKTIDVEFGWKRKNVVQLNRVSRAITLTNNMAAIKNVWHNICSDCAKFSRTFHNRYAIPLACSVRLLHYAYKSTYKFQVFSTRQEIFKTWVYEVIVDLNLVRH